MNKRTRLVLDARDMGLVSATATAEWIDWYNHHRLHSATGYLPTAEYESMFDAHHLPDQRSWSQSGDSTRLGTVPVGAHAHVAGRSQPAAGQ
jgi:hypothetical protein